MRLSPSTVKVLKNFSTINKSIWIDKGKKLTTISPREQSILAIAELEDEFPREFGILEISRFLSCLSLFDQEKYNIDFNETGMFIHEGHKQLTYYYAERKVLQSLPPEDLEIELPGSLIEFDIPQRTWTEAIKFLHVLGLDAFTIVGEHNAIFLKIHTPKDPTSDVFSSQVGQTNKQFNLIFKSDYVGTLLEGDYHVTVSEGLTLFKTGNVSYYIAPDATSEYPQ